MAVTEQELEQAQTRAQALRRAGYAVSARYERRRSRIVVHLSTGVQVAFPVALAEGLAGAAPEDLAAIEISPAGLGLRWPRLDADLHVPALLRGVLGSESWMAGALGAKGGRARSSLEAAAARTSGLKGGRPKSTASRQKAGGAKRAASK